MPSAVFEKIIPHHIDRVYKAITDFESYPKFVDSISKIDVLEVTTKSAKLACVAHFLKDFRFILKVSKQKPTMVAWKMESGDLFKRNEGLWKLKEISPLKTMVTYSMDIDFAIPVPGFLVKKFLGPSWDRAIENYLDHYQEA
jgi:ribosome-associated toxin RatA of RatAB toxin-antitoxin module